MVPEAREFNISLELQDLNVSNKGDEANDGEVISAHSMKLMMSGVVFMLNLNPSSSHFFLTVSSIFNS